MAATCAKRSACQTTDSADTPSSAATARSRFAIASRPFGERLAR